MNGLNADPGWRIAWVARLKVPFTLVSRPPTMARTAPSADMMTTAASTLEPSLTFSSNTLASARSAARWTCWSKVVLIVTSSVVSLVRKPGPDSITQSAK